MTNQEAGTLERDDAPALYFRWRGAVELRGAVLVVHGYGEHGGRYEHVASFLAERGYGCFVIDYRGWGRAGGRRGFVERFEEYLDDCEFGLRKLRSEFAPDVPTFVLGHSQGGLIAALHGIRHGPGSVNGVILVSPALRFAVPVPSWKRLAGSLAAKIWPTLALDSGLDRNLLTHDREIVQATLRDPLCQTKASARWFTESLAAQAEVLAGAASFRSPLLLLVAGQDQIADPQSMETFFEECGVADKSVLRFPSLYHEVLNELPENRAAALRGIAEWLDARTGGNTPL